MIYKYIFKQEFFLQSKNMFIAWNKTILHFPSLHVDMNVWMFTVKCASRGRVFLVMGVIITSV